MLFEGGQHQLCAGNLYEVRSQVQGQWERHYLEDQMHGMMECQSFLRSAYRWTTIFKRWPPISMNFGCVLSPLNCIHVSLNCVFSLRLSPAHGETQGNQSEERGNEERRFKRNETSSSWQCYPIVELGDFFGGWISPLTLLNDRS